VDDSDAGGRAGAREEELGDAKLEIGNSKLAGEVPEANFQFPISNFKMKNSYIGQAWLVIVLSLCFGVALAAVQTTLNPKIDANKLRDTISQIPNLVPGATDGKAETVGGQTVYRAVDSKGQQVGWVIPARGQGFADVIELLIGTDKDVQQITGLYVLKQLETPGLGDFITSEGWRSQFKNREISGELTVTKAAPKADTEIQGVTGATISSVSVVGIVNGAVTKFRSAVNP
jgi:Na+-translocating ferredoxin:NAD+ oxidoreductase subunit G